MTQTQNQGGSAPRQADKPSPKPSPDAVNHGNQLNRDHKAYWQSRGEPMPADPKARR